MSVSRKIRGIGGIIEKVSTEREIQKFKLKSQLIQQKSKICILTFLMYCDKVHTCYKIIIMQIFSYSEQWRYKGPVKLRQPRFMGRCQPERVIEQ